MMEAKYAVKRVGNDLVTVPYGRLVGFVFKSPNDGKWHGWTGDSATKPHSDRDECFQEMLDNLQAYYADE